MAASVSMLLLHGCALAINGAQPGGNGIKNASMGGASIALPLDAVAAANNPRTTLNGTGTSTGTSLTSKVQMFMLGGQ